MYLEARNLTSAHSRNYSECACHLPLVPACLRHIHHRHNIAKGQDTAGEKRVALRALTQFCHLFHALDRSLIMEDPAEIAALAQEFMSSLDNVPQEVEFLLGEIREKDKRVGELTTRIGRFETQLRDLLTKSGTQLSNEATVLPETERVKAERLEKRILDSNSRVHELAGQKEEFAMQLWRLIHRHTQRLALERKKIAPRVLEGLAEPSIMPAPGVARGTPTPITSIVPSLATSAGGGGTLFERRKSGPALSAPKTSQRPSSTGGQARTRQGTPTSEQGGSTSRASSPSVRLAGRKHSRPSLSNLGSPPPDQVGGVSKDSQGAGHAGTPSGRSGTPRERRAAQPASAVAKASSRPAAGAGGQQEGDEDALYCYCQNVSFGEMISCDGSDCKYEWFHISCVGLSNPLPDTWYCDDCKAKMETIGTPSPPPKKKKKVSS